MKRCAKCGGTEFANNGRCRPCIAAWWRQYRKTKAGQASERRRRKTPGARAAQERYNAKTGFRASAARAEARLRLHYGIDFHDWALMFERQSGECAGCLSPLLLNRTTHVDHCHETGKVRGLLCNDCNLTVGLAHNSSSTLVRLSEYLSKAAAS